MTHLLLASLLGFSLGPIVPPSVESTEASGEFAALPFAEWNRPLPGDPVNAVSHSERGELAFRDGKLYLGSAGGEALYALDAQSGALLHTYEANAAVQSAPVFTDEGLYFCDEGGYTFFYRYGEREAAWSHFGGAPITSAPTLGAGRLFVASVDDTVYALNATSGELIWRYDNPPALSRETELTLYGAPSPVIRGGDLLTGFSDGSLVAISIQSGAKTWSKRVGEGTYPDLIAPPVEGGNSLFAAGFDGPFVAIDPTTQAVRWSLDFGSSSESTLIASALFIGGTDGALRRVDARTGEVEWEWDSETGGTLTKPVLTAAGLISASSEGTIYLSNPEDGALLWSYEPEVRLAGFSVQPLLVGEAMYAVTNAGNLLKFRAFAVPTQE